MAGPKPMEVDRVAAAYDWGSWEAGASTSAGWSWGIPDGEPVTCSTCDEDYEEGNINAIKGGGKKGGKGCFQGHCYLCGGFGHS